MVIDEADRMVEKSHFEELHQLLEMINVDEMKKSKRQNFVFSATLSFVPDLPKYVKQNKRKALNNTPEDKLKSVGLLNKMFEAFICIFVLSCR